LAESLEHLSSEEQNIHKSTKMMFIYKFDVKSSLENEEFGPTHCLAIIIMINVTDFETTQSTCK